jgi:(2Fe-2S) ferredoxin
MTASPAAPTTTPRPCSSAPRRRPRSWACTARSGNCRVNRAGCFDRCAEGPVCVVYPDAVWYTYVDEADIDEIVESHLRDGKVVERLKI